MATITEGASHASAATTTFDRSGRHLTVYVAGELDAESAPAVATATLEHLRRNDAHVWIDLSATTYCDSSGIAMLYKLNKHVTSASSYLTVCSPTGTVRRVIEACNPYGTLAVRT